MRHSSRLFSAFCIAAFLGALGCDHKVESPAVTADPEGQTGQPGPVAPDLVCAEQLLTAVTLSGDGFTPFPTQTLQNTVQLLLPKIELTRTKAIDGTAVSGATPVAVPDDVDDLAHSHVRWFSEQKMGFDVYPELGLEPGLYAIKVTNRDDVHSADFPNAFAAVPRPAIDKVAPDILCDAQTAQTVTLAGSGFLDVGGTLPVVHFQEKDFAIQSVDGCIDVPGPHSAGVVRTCTTAVFTLPVGSCTPTTPWDASNVPNLPKKEALTLTNPATAACVSTDSVTIDIAPPPGVTSITPDLICNAQGDQSLVIAGAGFLQLGSVLPTVTVGTQTYNASALLECTEVPGTFAEGAVKSCLRLQFTIPQGSLDAGRYDVVVTNPAPADCHSVEKLELTVVPPPKLVSIAPDLVCDAQGDQVLVLSGSDFLQVGATLPIVTVSDGTTTLTYTPTSTENSCEVLGTFAEGEVLRCTTLKFTVKQGDLPPGDYGVVVTNPPPANCSSSDLVNLHVAPPPTITGLGQGGICTAQADQTITVLGTDFLTIGGQLPTVTIGTLTCTDAANATCKITGATGCTPVPGTFSEGAVQECTGLTVVVPMGALAAGSYPVSVTNPAPADCTTTNATVSLKVVPPPTVTGVAPASICTNGGTLTLTGTDFGADPTVTLTLAGSPDIVATDVTVNADGTSLTAEIPAGAEPDTNYTILVNNGCDDTAPHKTVHIVPGPKLFFADPEVVYNGLNTRVTLYVTSLTLPLTEVSITPTGGGTPIVLVPPATGATVDASGRKVQVIIPAGTPPGTYDLELADSVDCPASLAGAITVTESLTLSLKSVVPPFGWKSANTDIAIYRDAAAPAPKDKPFVTVPRVFMNPSNATGTEPAIQLTATSMTDANTLTSVVPKGSLVGTYDLIVVNPDGAVGLLADAFEVTDLPPPVITSITPASVVSGSDQKITLNGDHFRTDATTPSPLTVTVEGCADATGTPVATKPAVTNVQATCDAAGNCSSVDVTLDASGLTPGSSCVLRLTNGDDGTWAIYSAIGVTNSSLNLVAPLFGTDLTTERRALVAAAGNATTAARFAYAIGGDNGTSSPATTLASVESTQVDFFGGMSSWSLQRNALRGPRAFAQAAQLGRYVYLCGGTDGAAPLKSCERAMILDPLEAPILTVADLLVKDTGLDAGYWFYRISATFSDTDPENPLGETLPSDEIVVKVPALLDGKKVQNVLSWSAPVDSLGVTLPNISGYRIYRSADLAHTGSNTEVLVKTITGNTTFTWTDDGSAAPGTETFLPLGSTGTWAPLPDMSVARQGLAMTWAADPDTTGRFYVYAMLGKDTATTALSSYEFLTVDVQANGHQTTGAWTGGTATFPAARWQAAAFRGDSTLSSLIANPNTYLWVGGGISATGNGVGDVDAAKVGPDGQLLTNADVAGFIPVRDWGGKTAGYGACAAVGMLFTFGGGNAAPSAGATSASLVSPAPTLANNAWNSNGAGMRQARYLMGTAVQSAYIFLIGGQVANAPVTVTKTTEVVIW